MQKPLIPALFLFALLSFGCGKSTDTPDNSPVWVVTYFNDKIDKEEDTAIFAGYSFDLNIDNSMVIHLPDGTTKVAKWRLESSDTVLAMDMEDPVAPMDGMMGKWDVVEYTDTSIKLKGSLGPVSSVYVNQGEELQLKKQ